ncbi:hypothetical protein ACOSQ3_030691 [Xanthoceras sorbifolium]
MELEFSSFSLLLTFLVFVSMVLKIGKRFKTNETTLSLPPGPWKLPLIGNLHQLVGSLPHHRLRDLSKRYGPLMHLQLGEVSTVVVSSPEFAKEVMRTRDVIFASRPRILASEIVGYGSSNIIFSPYGDYWRQLRKICISELLSTKRVQSFRSVREEEVSNLINWIGSKAGSVINLTEKIHSLAFGVTARAAFGQRCKDQEIFIAVVKEGTKLGAGFSFADLFPSIEAIQWISGIKSQLEKFHQEFDRILENIIKEHQKDQKETLEIDKSEESEEDRDHLVDVLLKVQKQSDSEFQLTTDNIKAVILDIFSAGSETSATTIDWAIAELMKNPRLMEQAQTEVREIFNRVENIDETGISEMKFLKLVIKETLRLHPPAPLLVPRESGERCEIKGFEIPIKTRVIVNAWAIGRDPEYWTEPESFIPERFLDSPIDYKGNNFEYIPFGAGRRICPGMSFGLANVELPLAMLLYHFDWKLPNRMKCDDLDMTEAFGLSVRRKEDMYMIATPYHPPSTSNKPEEKKSGTFNSMS